MRKELAQVPKRISKENEIIQEENDKSKKKSIEIRVYKVEEKNLDCY